MKRRWFVLAVMVALGISACSQAQVVLKKRVGDEIKLRVSISGAPEHKFVGCSVVYPAWIMDPVLTDGNKVSFLAGDVYNGLDQETICTKGAGSVALSRVLKSGAAVAGNGSVATLNFKCVAAGTGVISLTNADIGYVDGNGAVVKYNAVSSPLNVATEIPATVTFTVEVF
jgi:hypothetical protein